LKTKFVFEERYFSTNWWGISLRADVSYFLPPTQASGAFEWLFAPRGGNLNKPVFKSSNAWGVAQGGGDVELSN